MNNIVWKLPDGHIGVTTVVMNFDSAQHAADLKQNGSIPEDWVMVAIDYEGPFPDSKFGEAFVWDQESKSVILHIPEAKEIVKRHLRRKRAPLLAELDIQFQRNLETGADNTEVVQRKEELRAVTDTVDSYTTEQELLQALVMEI